MENRLMVKRGVNWGKRGKWLSLGMVIMAAALMAVITQTGYAWSNESTASSVFPFNQLARPAIEIPNTQNRSHRVGNVWMTITNWGIFGSQFRGSQLVEQEGPYAGQLAPSFEFPAGSGLNYLFWGGLWFGAIVGSDTLVSTGVVDEAAIAEFFPEVGAGANIIERSNRRSSQHYSPFAISEQEYIAVYTDTLTDPAFVNPDPFLQRRHIPIGLEVTQRSYSWAYDYAQDFVLMDFVIRNISNQIIEKPYMGVFVDADCLHEFSTGEGAYDDYSGYLHTVPSPYPGLRDTINIAWTADNDGDPVTGAFDRKSPLGIAGTRVVRGPARQEGCGAAPLNYSFNWWTRSEDSRFDWGPRKKQNFRNFGTGGEGTPSGDLNKYYIMSNGEFDYDQLFSAVDFSDSTDWQAPKRAGLAQNIADGTDTRYLFSFGPLEDIEPGDSTYVTLGYVGGDNFHVGPDDFKKYFRADRPSRFYEKLDFRDFAINAQWAAWVFDNPGVDTDGDGCRGLYSFAFCRDTMIIDVDPTPQDPYTTKDTILSNCDTVWYAGDGVPDFKGPPPPPAPIIEVSAEPEKLTVRWTGEYSELGLDPFTFRRDFEGFRVYIAEYNALAAYTLVASWDIIDYKRMSYNPSTRKWVQTADPFRLETLYEMYGMEDFDPRDYSAPNRHFVDEYDSMFYFLPQDWNRGNEYITNGRIVQNQIQYVRTDSLWDSVNVEWQRFGHYECVIDNLLPSQPYFVAVTTFDYGNREMLAPLESSPLINATTAYASYSSERAAEENMPVTVYPNPYKISHDYRGSGFEDRAHMGWSERSRRIHFTNLPAACTIKIFSLDGDLIRQINHPDSRFSDTPWHCEWDLITRNTQAAVSGLYLWSVESDLGVQIGKLVILK